MFHVERKRKKSDVVESVYVLLSGSLIMCAETSSRIAMFHVNSTESYCMAMNECVLL